MPQEQYEKCFECDGFGWVTGTEAGHCCDGTQESCNINCPIPIQIQEQCQRCGGCGEVDYRDNRPEIKVIEETFNTEDLPF